MAIQGMWKWLKIVFNGGIFIGNVELSGSTTIKY